MFLIIRHVAIYLWKEVSAYRVNENSVDVSIKKCL